LTWLPDCSTVVGYLSEILAFLARTDTSATGELVQIAQASVAYLFGEESKIKRLVKHPLGKAVVAVGLAFQLFTGVPLTLPAAEAPAPDSEVILVLEGLCHQPMELGAGSPPPSAIGPGDATGPAVGAAP
jgi:hypothetical protein